MDRAGEMSALADISCRKRAPPGIFCLAVIVVELDPLQIIGLLSLVTLIPVYSGLRYWLEHKLRRQTAEANGWRYSNRGWRMFISPRYSLAGTTARGVVWHLRRVKKGRQWLYEWSAQSSLLPYGAFLVQPSNAAALPQESSYGHLRHVAAGNLNWRTSYRLMVSHTVLSDRFFSREVETALLEWPDWPELGALEELLWTKGELVVRARHKNDWLTINRIVTLGTMLVENASRE